MSFCIECTESRKTGSGTREAMKAGDSDETNDFPRDLRGRHNMRRDGSSNWGSSIES
ncbi:hypothetical protein [Parasedimentitalea marina]|uniref:hypothetical protein n=1 Tax=Parasedimentitalea marina TaxID=2483033 RepID=UPI0013E323D7|nr:hypothetical protein [Parasedimentitalea marina]